jgi:phosphoribosylanthranilate isomerase
MMLKICGITRLADAEHAVRQGATALGFVFWPQSPRVVSVERAAAILRALPPGVTKVGVFVNEDRDVIRRVAAASGIGMVQLHGDERPGFAADLGIPVLRSVTLDRFDEARIAWPEDVTFLLDAADPVRRGGTGRQVDWGSAAEAARRRRVILAGGLTPENVADAIATVGPFGVDVSSGVEEAPGVKDVGKITRFLSNAREAFAACERRETERR